MAEHSVSKKQRLGDDDDRAKIRLKVFSTLASSAMRQADAPEDIHGCNKPALRRDRILEALARASVPVELVEVPAPDLTLSQCPLALARSVHNDGYVTFLETAWERWAAQEHKDVTMCGPAGELLTGNAVNRDECQRPGSGVISQACFYLVDKEAPVYEALLPALAADLAIAKAALDSMVASVAEKVAALPPLNLDVGDFASYCLVTHPGHHASRANGSGWVGDLSRVHTLAMVHGSRTLQLSRLPFYLKILLYQHCGPSC